jgi:excisionase family DNA binding protein
MYSLLTQQKLTMSPNYKPMNQHTAEAVFQDFRDLEISERMKFFQLLSSSLEHDNQTHEQVFGHLAGAEFTAQQAAEYLGMSISTFRRNVGAKKIQARSSVGRSDMLATADLKAFKKAQRAVKRS